MTSSFSKKRWQAYYQSKGGDANHMSDGFAVSGKPRVLSADSADEKLGGKSFFFRRWCKFVNYLEVQDT